MNVPPDRPNTEAQKLKSFLHESSQMQLAPGLNSMNPRVSELNLQSVQAPLQERNVPLRNPNLDYDSRATKSTTVYTLSP